MLLRRSARQGLVLATAWLALAGLPAKASDCTPWPGEPHPLPRIGEGDRLLVRWAELRAKELARHARALEDSAPVEANRVWRHLLCLDPGDQAARSGVQRTQPLRVHRPEILVGSEAAMPAADTDSWSSLDAPLLLAARWSPPPRREPPAARPEPISEPLAARPEPSSELLTARPQPTEPPAARPEPSSEPLAARPDLSSEPLTARPEPSSELLHARPEPSSEPLAARPEPSTEPLAARPEPSSAPLAAPPEPSSAPLAAARPEPSSGSLPRPERSSGSLRQIDRWLATAESQLAAARFDEALATSAEARARLDGMPAGRNVSRSRVRVELIEATAQAARGGDEAARACFVRVLALDPAFVLDARTTSPKLMRLLDAARVETGVSR
jgi:hypothetical protein